MAERKTERAKQLLIRYIRDRQMKNGAKLPPQNELRRIFHYGATTICSAVNALREDGVLEVRDKVGVFVIDPDAGGHAGRVVGITMLTGENNFYYSCLLTSLQMHLVENGCTVRLFRSSRKAKNGDFLFEIDDFPGLRRSVESEEIQGLIHLDDFSHAAIEFIRKKKLPLVFVGSPGGIAEDGVFFDYKKIISEACRMLKRSHARRPALFCQATVRPEVEHVFRENFGGASRIFSCKTFADEQRVIREILAMPECERPDWLICLEDLFALALACTLARHLTPEKMPGAFVMFDRAAQIHYPLSKLICCDNDLHQFAALGVESLMKAMMSGKQDIGAVFYFPKISDLSTNLL